jgi:uncharacterized protein YcbK (DUF882 family)
MISRRNFLRTVFAIASAYPIQEALAFTKSERRLNLYNIHTREILNITYYESGSYNTDAIKKTHCILRCHYTNEIMPVDIKLIDLLCDIKDIFGKEKEIHIISGYRSPAYNEYLRSLGRKVVKNSFHLHGLAIDFSIPSVGISELCKAAKSFSGGGVGRYPEFVHIDTGRVRYW